MSMNNCLTCGKEYDTTSGPPGMTKKNCSYKCHMKYYRSRNKANLSGDASSSTSGSGADDADPVYTPPKIEMKPVVQASVSPGKATVMSLTFNEFPPAARWIISELQTKDSEKKDRIKELEGEVKTITQERNDLKEQIRENSKPSTLEGIAESSLVKELIPHIGPALGNLLNGFASKMGVGGAGQLAGAENVSEETNAMLAATATWFVGLPVEQQKIFFSVVRGLAEKSPEEFAKIVEQFSNLLFNNTAFNQQGGNYGTSGY